MNDNWSKVLQPTVAREDLYGFMRGLKDEVSQEGFQVPTDDGLSDDQTNDTARPDNTNLSDNSPMHDKHTHSNANIPSGDGHDDCISDGDDEDVSDDNVPVDLRFYDNEAIFPFGLCVTFHESSQHKQSKERSVIQAITTLIALFDFCKNNDWRIHFREALALIRSEGLESALYDRSILSREHVRSVLDNLWQSDLWLSATSNTQFGNAIELERLMCRDWSLIERTMAVLASFQSYSGNGGTQHSMAELFAKLLSRESDTEIGNMKDDRTRNELAQSWLDSVSPVHLFFIQARAHTQYYVTRDECSAVRDVLNTVLNTKHKGNPVFDVTLVGAYRRGCTSCTTIDIVVTETRSGMNAHPDDDAFTTVVSQLLQHAQSKTPLLAFSSPQRVSSPRFLTVVSAKAQQVTPYTSTSTSICIQHHKYILDLKVVALELQPYTLLYYTGPHEHNMDVAQAAQDMHVCLYPRLSRVKGVRNLPIRRPDTKYEHVHDSTLVSGVCDTEAQIYEDILDCDNVIPTERIHLTMRKSHLDNCRFSAWYPQFKSITLSAHILPIPREFIHYLKADGLLLPETEAKLTYSQKQKWTEVDESDESDWSDEGEEADIAIIQNPNFQAFLLEVKKVIQAYGTIGVFPKLNWSSPKDAQWIATGGTLRCETVNDVLLLLKSSDFVSHDVHQPYEQCEDVDQFGYAIVGGDGRTSTNADVEDVNTTYELVLKKWKHLQPAMEFRCFVRDNKLIAASQRHHDMYFSALGPLFDEISERLQTFYDEHIHERFADPSYVFDVYVGSSCITLLDFNPFGDTTDSLMFEWDELRNTDAFAETEPEIRIVQTAKGIRQSSMSYARVPRDIVDMSLDGKMEGFVDLCATMQNREAKEREKRKQDRGGISSDSDSDSDIECVGER
eukprot:CFRG2261T1